MIGNLGGTLLGLNANYGIKFSPDKIIYGALRVDFAPQNGTVLTISNDAILIGSKASAPQDSAQSAAGLLVHSVRIGLTATWIQIEGDATLLTLGLSVTAEVKTGNRRAIEFLLDPLMERGRKRCMSDDVASELVT